MRFCTACGSRFTQEVRFCPTDGQPTEHLEDEKTVVTDPLMGQVIDGRYRIDQVLGEGGMGVVYSVMHISLGKRMALKVLRGEMAKDDHVVRRFVQEAQACSSIGHPNIIDISDFGRLPEGTSYFVMEHLEGESLTQLIQRGGSLPMNEATRMVEQIASALGAAHSAGVVHRDLKPDNIFLISRGNAARFVKVLDFGIAKVGGANSKLTKTGMVFGTPYYMSPEQAAGQSVDQRTDIYALGIIMYEMFTGSLPFEGDTFMGILSKQMFEPPVRPLERIAAQELPIEPIILRCLEKRPEDRYQSMDELLADLSTISSGGSIAIGSSASQRPPAPLAFPGALGPGNATAAAKGKKSEGSKARWLLLAGVVALLGVGALVGGVAAFLQHQDDTTSPPIAAPVNPSLSMPAVPITTPIQAGGATPPANAANAAGNGAAATGSGETETVVQAPPTLIRIDSEPSGAMVEQDGVLIGNTPLEMPRPTGSESVGVELSLDGREPTRVRLSAHSPAEIRVQLHGAAPAPTRRTRHSRHRPTGTSSTSSTATPPMTEAPPPPPPPRMRQSSTDVVDPWAQ